MQYDISINVSAKGFLLGIQKLYKEHGIKLSIQDAVFDVLINSRSLDTREIIIYNMPYKQKYTTIGINHELRAIYYYILDKITKLNYITSAFAYLCLLRLMDLKKNKTISIFTLLYSQRNKKQTANLMETLAKYNALEQGRIYLSLLIGASINKNYTRINNS